MENLEKTNLKLYRFAESSSNREFWGITQAVSLENSFRLSVAYHIWFQSKNSRHDFELFEFPSKTANVTGLFS